MDNCKVWLATVLMGVFAAGCGDDGEPDRISASKKVGELSSNETADLCDEVDRTFDRLESILLNVLCTERARDQPATCSRQRLACINDPSAWDAFDVDIEFECSGSNQAFTAVCKDLTVGEVRSCIDGLLDVLQKASDQYTCTSDESIEVAPAFPEACERVGTRCASLSNFSL